MNSREVSLVTSATLFGALASAIALGFLFNSSSLKKKEKKNQQERFSSPLNGVVPSKPSPFDPSKRQGYLSWDDYFMAIAFLSAERSKDPNRQVGACLVSQNGIILGIGYNGFPRGCSDDKLPWAKKSESGDPLETKYPYVCHAEVNAILNTNHASAAGQSGVSEVIYFVEKRLNNSQVEYIASHKLLSMAGVRVRKHRPQKEQILINFEEAVM
ncbi:deoxycytidylate deaminase isoform X3 [Rhodamnia argentea]|uniref:dCMP deaminase n=1 Tax=Rhodamnia argentea TaxID=178133 RepID=A0ABM3HGT6_9MYRT|nr:deoxycytidylate deaminase isoform X3 [Rhodamnia argentea]